MELKEVTDFYQADFNKSELVLQLQILWTSSVKAIYNIQDIDIHKHFQSLPATQLSFLSQVTRLIKFVLLMPATNDVSEQSASAIHRIQTYVQLLNYG